MLKQKMGFYLLALTLALAGCRSAKMKVVKHVKSTPINAQTEGDGMLPDDPKANPNDPRRDRGPESPTPVNPIDTDRPKKKPPVVNGDDLGALPPRPRPCASDCGSQQVEPVRPRRDSNRPLPRPSGHGNGQGQRPTPQTPGVNPTPGGNQNGGGSTPDAQTPDGGGNATCGEGGWSCQPVRESCEPVSLTAELERPQLDILFVVDTSASLRGGSNRGTGGELEQMANAMSHFVNSLDQNTDIRIGMLLGHGPASNMHGKLFRTSDDGPAVIDFNKFVTAEKQRNPSANDTQVRQAAITKITQILSNRMRSVPSERGGAQGEAMLLSLYDALTTPNLLQAIKSPGQNQPGLLRAGVPLAVIMVSDEQDVCFKYEGSGFSPPLVDKETRNGQSVAIPDKIETAFFNSNACQKAVNGRDPLTPGHVYDALKRTVGDKLIMTSIVYVDNNVPQGVEDENEMGHGMLELTALASGQVANIADVKANQDNSQGAQSFNQLLQQLGRFAAFKMHFNHPFTCVSPTDPSLVDPATVEVHVLDERNQEIALFKSECSHSNQCGNGVTGPATWKYEQDGQGNNRYGIVSVSPQTLEEVLKRHNYTRGTVRMSFVQKYVP